MSRANQALSECGSPALLDVSNPGGILQLGLEPNRVGLHRCVPGVDLSTAWETLIESRYGVALALLVDLDRLLRIKSGIDGPRHQEIARVVLAVQELRAKRS